MHQGVALSRASAMARQRHTNRCGRDAGSAREHHSTCVGQWGNSWSPGSQKEVGLLVEGDEQCGSAHSKRPRCEWQPPVWRRVVCRSQQTSSRQHKNSLLGGVMGAFRLHSEKRLDHLRTHREHSVKLTPCLCLSGNGTGTAGIVTKIPQPCQACSSNVAYPPARTPRNPVLPVALRKRGGGGAGACYFARWLCAYNEKHVYASEKSLVAVTHNTHTEGCCMGQLHKR